MILAPFSQDIFSLLFWPAKRVVITTSTDEELACGDSILNQLWLDYCPILNLCCNQIGSSWTWILP